MSICEWFIMIFGEQYHVFLLRVSFISLVENFLSGTFV